MSKTPLKLNDLTAQEQRIKALNEKLESSFPEWWKDRYALHIGDTAALIAGAWVSNEKGNFETAERLYKMAADRIDADLEVIQEQNEEARGDV